MPCAYRLNVLYRSNERPFATAYDPSPYGPKTDDEAVRWAVGMREGLGGSYDVTLVRDTGEVIPMPADGLDEDA